MSLVSFETSLWSGGVRRLGAWFAGARGAPGPRPLGEIPRPAAEAGIRAGRAEQQLAALAGRKPGPQDAAWLEKALTSEWADPAGCAAGLPLLQARIRATCLPAWTRAVRSRRSAVADVDVCVACRLSCYCLPSIILAWRFCATMTARPRGRAPGSTQVFVWPASAEVRMSRTPAPVAAVRHGAPGYSRLASSVFGYGGGEHRGYRRARELIAHSPDPGAWEWPVGAWGWQVPAERGLVWPVHARAAPAHMRFLERHSGAIGATRGGAANGGAAKGGAAGGGRWLPDAAWVAARDPWTRAAAARLFRRPDAAASPLDCLPAGAVV